MYGAHLSQKAIDAIIAPKKESRDLVLQWLEKEGLSEHAMISSREDFIIVEASVAKIEKLLQAEYSTFGNSHSLSSPLSFSSSILYHPQTRFLQ
jgi:tripeptidyl-peptidase-1